MNGTVVDSREGIESPAELLEVKTLPGLTGTSLYPDGARAIGLDFPDLVAELVLRPHDRGSSDVGGG